MYIIFDTVNIYYLPQYQPISEELTNQGHKVKFVCYKNKNNQATFEQVFNDLNVEFSWVDDELDAKNLYVKEKPDWIFFGNAFSYLDDIHKYSKTAQLGHGVGPKPSYYHKSRTPMTVRFIEGELRLRKIRELYPHDNFVQVGFSKLDPILQGKEKGFDLVKMGLDPNKKTLLFAPTFNPSSLECFPDNWPEKFAEFNVLIKPHTFTYTRKQYQAQRDKLLKWKEFCNTYVAKQEDVSLVPFMKHADVLISEASSTLFEFVGLNKPVIVCDFYKLKWSYRGIFKYRFYKRFGKDNVIYRDIGLHINAFDELSDALHKQLASPSLFALQREQYTRDHIGPTDGLASQRIVEYLTLN